MSSATEYEIRFKAWLAEHEAIVTKVTRSFAVGAADAAELRQEMLVQLWGSLGSYAGQAKPSTWIYRVCLNTAMTWRRGTTRRLARVEPVAEVGELAAASASPAEHAGDREILEKLYAAIHAMSDPDRALVLLALDGLAYREIAEITGLTENHVGVALTRARKRLAALMKGVTDELE